MTVVFERLLTFWASRGLFSGGKGGTVLLILPLAEKWVGNFLAGPAHHTT